MKSVNHSSKFDTTVSNIVVVISARCAHCIRLLNILDASKAEYDDRPLIVVIKGLSNEADVKELLVRKRLTYPINLIDGNAVVNEIRYVPTFILLDNNNRVTNSTSVVINDEVALMATIENLEKAETVLFQRNVSACGAASMAMILSSFNIERPYDEIEMALVKSGVGTTMKDIRNFSLMHGLFCEGWKLRTKDLVQIKFPAIVLIDNNHYVVIDEVEGDQVFLRDPLRGKMQIPISDFDEHWNGEILLFDRAPIQFDEQCHCQL